MCLRAVILPLGDPLGIFISMEGVVYYYVQKGLLIGYIFAFLNLRGYIFDFCSMYVVTTSLSRHTYFALMG